jgi:hypothetical protein
MAAQAAMELGTMLHLALAAQPGVIVVGFDRLRR